MGGKRTLTVVGLNEAILSAGNRSSLHVWVYV